MRLDIYVFNNFALKSREYARSLIKNGDVTVNGVPVTKAGYEINGGENVVINDSLRYVGRGGLKLERALDVFKISVSDKTALDIGASTGGFTDCLLQNGAEKVFAVDVGHGQLAEKLRNDPRVINLEGVHINVLSEETVGKVGIITCDVSFISLKLVLPSMRKFADENTDIVCLFKPQFEYGKKVKNGVIKDSTIHEELISDFSDFAEKEGFDIVSRDVSPILGGDGNKEFLFHIKLKNIQL
ncbi:MAG: TlyA family RNA methyltransferase [Ruminococcaceae bacterium]|nr:TlyA family RNA methyltransferase [Oscillospiraceae bacterium]